VTPQRYQRLERLFNAACAVAPGERAAMLEQDLTGEPSLREDLEALLVEDADPSAFLQSPLLGGEFHVGSALGDLGGLLEPGDTVGDLTVIREIGRGGQGMVYLAQDRWLGRPVALKMLAPGAFPDGRRADRFRREARVAARLDHPGICAVHDVGRHGTRPYVVLRYVEGETLALRLADQRANGSLPARNGVMEALRLVERAARAVHAAHEAGITHRDLKPANIMVTPSGDPVVLDFGLAADETSPVSLTLSGDVFGTPDYMAPEQIASGRGADRRSDVYALGATLHECLTLQPPFRAPTRSGLYRAILDQEPPDARRSNGSVPRDLAVVVTTALAKEPDRRYQTASDLAEDLRRVRESRTILARPAGPIARGYRWVRRNPALAGTAAVTVLALAGGLAATSGALQVTRASLEQTRRANDVRALAQLRAAATELWPLLPESVDAMDGWLDEAEQLHAQRLPVHQAYLASLPAGDERDRIASFVSDLSGFEDLYQEVYRRRREASTIAAASVTAHDALWRRTVEAIADVDTNPVYGGLRIEPQVGLAPLGQGSDSQLFEFAHLQTGEVPRRDPATGRLLINEETGVVFVLIPATAFDMGAYWPDPEHPLGEPNVDPHRARLSDEAPVHHLELAPFFISKYEMTQGQWLRTTGENPSYDYPGRRPDSNVTLLHPVEHVSWQDAVAALRRFGLVLPTEAQWECAARAGTTTVWWTGNERETLIGAANLADESAIRAGLDWEQAARWLDDGYIGHAPAGTFRPNPYGLHEVHGNVWELVLDRYGSYEEPVRPGDGLRIVEDTGYRIQRGGGIYENHWDARSSRRYDVSAGGATYSSGLRPARAVTGLSRAGGEGDP
jgi:formylglycine-generating enzyme required for sulfatase activity/tRNA A-37 threonylcarbamoyl transferase component Bud32